MGGGICAGDGGCGGFWWGGNVLGGAGVVL